ncbi:SOGA3 family protein [Megaselia abdita]
MQHLYPLTKGDQLCPLGFHPQVRWPTRCKRCFRDYKEHGFKRGSEDMTISSPNLMEASPSRATNAKSWTSTQNLSSSNSENSSEIELRRRPQSWTSTPDINEDDNRNKPVNVTVNLQLPTQRRHTTIIDLNELENSVRKPPKSPSITTVKSSSPNNVSTDLIILKSDSLAERARKMNIIKKMKSQNSRENSREKSISRQNSVEIETDEALNRSPECTTKEVEKSKVVEVNTAKIKSVKNEVKVDFKPVEKNQYIMRKSTIEDSKTVPYESMILQDKVIEMRNQIEELKNDKRALALKLEQHRPTKSNEDIKQRLKAAEQLCEELLSENSIIKKELKGMETEIDEMHDAFHEDQSNECMKLRKELDQTNKNCRVLSFKLRKSEKRLEQMEQDKIISNNTDMQNKLRTLEEDLKLANERAKTLEESSTYSKKKTPMLGLLGKSNSADARITRESLTRGGSQEDPQKLLRDLKDASERESDLKEQLRFSEEESDMLKKKIARFEEENESLLMQVNKMASKTKGRKLSPIIRKRLPEIHLDKDEGISDEEDPSELRILLDLNEQESSILRIKIDDLEKERKESRLQIMQLRKAVDENNKVNETSNKQSKEIEDEVSALKNSISRKDKLIASLQAKVATLGNEITQQSSMKIQLNTAQDLLKSLKKEKDSLNIKLNTILNTKVENFPNHTPRIPTELTPKSHLKKWVIELENEVQTLTGLLKTNIESKNYEAEYKKIQEKCNKLESELKLTSEIKEKIDELSTENLKLSNEILKTSNINRANESKLQTQISKVVRQEELRSSLELENKKLKDSLKTSNNELNSNKKEHNLMVNKVNELTKEVLNLKCFIETNKISHEKQLKELKLKSTADSEKSEIIEARKTIKQLQARLDQEMELVVTLRGELEHFKEDNILVQAQLATQRKSLESELNGYKEKQAYFNKINVEKSELNVKLINANKNIKDLEMKILKTSSMEYEKSRLKNCLNEKETEYKRLKQENEMNIDLVFQLRREVEDLNGKISDFDRISRARTSVNDHNNSLENEIRTLRRKLEAAELSGKSESAAIRLRYEQQVSKLNSENSSMQKQCERFKKDRDTFKQLLESAQKKISDLKSNNTGRISRNSIHSSDNDDDRAKVHFLEKQIGTLEDQLCEFRLESNKLKSELVSEKSANAIKIAEMQSKLNEYEEDRVLATGRTKIPGMKTRLELSWQKEREEQQRLLQETSTLARDLRQTLYEVEREREKERLEMKRKVDQLKNMNDDEMEDGRKKISELQCDLLDLRDAHAKIRTSNERLRRDRERIEKELVRRRIEIEGGDRKLNFLLHTLDEFIKISPTILSSLCVNDSAKSKLEDKGIDNSYISLVISRINSASEDLHKHRRLNEEELEKNRLRKNAIRRAASQENDMNSREGAQTASILKIQRNNGNIKKCLSLDQSIQYAQNIWKKDDGSVSSIQSIGSDVVGKGSDYDSRLSGGSTQSDIPRGPRKKRKSLIGKLRSLSLTKNGRNSESELSVQGSDSDISVSNFGKRDFKGKLSGMFKRGSRSTSIDSISNDRPVAVTVVGENSTETNLAPARKIYHKEIKSSEKASTYTKSKKKP